MTLKDYLHSALPETSYIEEWCGVRLVGCHHFFGMGEKIDLGDGYVEDTTDKLLLMDGGDGEYITQIDINQEISFDENDSNAVNVIDGDENKLTLYFYKSIPIENPLTVRNTLL